MNFLSMLRSNYSLIKSLYSFTASCDRNLSHQKKKKQKLFRRQCWNMWCRRFFSIFNLRSSKPIRHINQPTRNLLKQTQFYPTTPEILNIFKLLDVKRFVCIALRTIDFSGDKKETYCSFSSVHFNVQCYRLSTYILH